MAKTRTEYIRVLILEDNPADAELIECELKEAGCVFSSRFVENKKSYIKSLEEFCPDIILSDYDLPSISGWEALQIRKEHCPDTPFILVTGAVGEERAIEVLTGGATDYVLKRNLSRLFPAVKRALHEAYEHRKRKEAEAERDGLLNDLEKRVRERTEALESEINDRKRFEKALRESEERFRIAQELSPDGFTILRPVRNEDGRVDDFIWIYENATIARLNGTDPDEVAGKRLLDVFPSHRNTPIFKAYVEAAETGESRVIEDMYSGESMLKPTWFRLAIVLMKGDIAVLAQDITERKKAELLSERQKVVLSGIAAIFHKALVCRTEEELGRECLAVAEWVTQSKLGFIGEINPKTKKMDDLAISNPGWEACAMLDQAGHGRKAPVDLGIYGIYGRVLLDGKGFFTNHPSSHPDSIGVPEGHPPLTAFLGVPLRQEDNIIGMIGLGNREEGYGPEELDSVEALSPAIVQALISKRAEESLRESREEYRDLVETANSIIMKVDRSGKVSFSNQYALDFFGYSQEEMIGADMGIFVPQTGAGGQSLETLLQNVLQNPDQFPESINENIKKNGERVWISWRNKGIRDSDGSIKGFLSIGQDMTERIRAEYKLKERSDQLENANRELESFSYSISHDLRAPLRVIDGFSMMVLEKAKDAGEETRRMLQVIRENALKMDTLIDNILEFSRAGRTEISRKTIDMDKLIDALWQEEVAAHPERRMELKKKKLPEAGGDEALIRQVLSNLLANAVKFTKNKETALIEVGGESTEAEKIYSVRDNGAGFDMKYYDKLFGVFQRLHSESEYEGTGVGLAIVQRIVNRHGGRVWAEGEVGKGATFYFSLPRR